MDPGTKIWTRDLEIGPGLARGGFGTKLGVRKTWFCEGMVSKLEIMGFPATQMDCMVPRRPLGKPVSPQTPLKNGSPRLFPISGNLGKVPLSPPVYPLWALCGPLSLSNSRSTTRGGLYVTILLTQDSFSPFPAEPVWTLGQDLAQAHGPHGSQPTSQSSNARGLPDSLL